jgi:RNA polymerase sigma-70 factor (ECF subfamily)
MDKEIVEKLKLEREINSSQPKTPLGWEEKKNFSDQALISLVKLGDKDAFNILVKRYEKKILNILYLQLGPINELEDLAQEVFLKVFKNLSKFRGESQFSTWLYRIAMNISYDYKRKNKINIFSLDENLDEDSDDTFKDFLTDSHEDLEKRIEREEIQKKIRNAIRNLPKEYQEVLILREFEGLSYKEIADILKCPVGTIESRLFRAREELKKIVKKELQEYEM